MFSAHVSGLFVQAVELSDCETTQALALQLLLSLVKNNQHCTHEMECYHGYSMIHQVLIKPKCIVGYHILKVSFSMTNVGCSIGMCFLILANSLPCVRAGGISHIQYILYL